MSKRLEEQPFSHPDIHSSVEDVTPRLEQASSRWLLFLGIVSFLSCLLTYLMRLDRVVGLFVDDAWYVMLAKALATNNSYSLINAPTPGITPLYPPFFPFLLSLLYRLAPNFPDNIWLLKSLSVASMFVAGGLAYVYFQREQNLKPLAALGIAVAMVLSPPLVFLATSTVMSECAFTAIFLGTILVVERGVRKIKDKEKKAQWVYPILFGMGGTLCFLTRSAAIGVIAAIFIYLILEDLRKPALIFIATVILLGSPWVIYARLHAPTPEQWNEQAGHIVEDYSKQFWQRQAGNIQSGRIEATELPERIWKNIKDVALRDLLRVTAAPLYETFRSFQAAEAWRQQDGYEAPGGATAFMSLIVTVFLLTGFIRSVREKITVAELSVAFSFGIMLLWPWEPFRFMLPLTALLILYILRGAEVAIHAHKKLRQVPSALSNSAVTFVVLGCILSISLYGNANYLIKKFSKSPVDQPPWISTFQENEKLFLWARDNLPQDEIISTSNPGLVYLYTGHKTVAFHDPAGNWEMWKKMNVRYLVRTSSFILPPPESVPEERGLKVIYRQPGILNLRITDFGPAANRGSWGVLNSPQRD
ncbi:MAG: ArnT family glycosyltransferase [Blastocatellales bacterium]